MSEFFQPIPSHKKGNSQLSATTNIPHDYKPATLNVAVTLEPHQQRVVDERNDLDTKIARLSAFIENSISFGGLPEAERMRLYAQHRVMVEYSAILGERINAF